MPRISRLVHGVLDYIFGIFLAASPWIFGFSEQELAPQFAVVFGGGTVLYSLLTNYECGIVRLIPFPGHLLLDLIFGFLLCSNWVTFDFGGRAAVVFTIFGAIEITVVLLTLRTGPPETQGMM